MYVTPSCLTKSTQVMRWRCEPQPVTPISATSSAATVTRRGLIGCSTPASPNRFRDTRNTSTSWGPAPRRNELLGRWSGGGTTNAARAAGALSGVGLLDYGSMVGARRASSSAAAVWARADVRRRWRSLVALALLAGLSAGFAFAALAGGRRTSTALDRLRDRTNASDAVVFASQVGVDRPDWSRLEARPEVKRLARWALLFGELEGDP